MCKEMLKSLQEVRFLCKIGASALLNILSRFEQNVLKRQGSDFRTSTQVEIDRSALTSATPVRLSTTEQRYQI